MQSKISIFLLSLAVIALLARCSDEQYFNNPDLVPDSPGTITIRLSNSDLTRSDDSENSEKLIDNVIIALYPDGTAEDIPATEVRRIEGINTYTSKIITLQLTEALTKSLFNPETGNRCRAFVLANVSAGDTENLPEYPTIKEMKNLPISSPFGSKDVQDSFVMTGPGIISYTPSDADNIAGKASGEIHLRRAAAKIKLNISLPAQIDIKDSGNNIIESWEPQTPEKDGIIRVYINNGVDRAVAYPVSEGETPWKPAADGFYNSDPEKENSYRILKNSGNGTYNIVTDVPFYTYPNAWGTNNLYETTQTTLTLIVRWKKTDQGTDQYMNYYYQVPVTPSEIHQIESNYTYNINLEVGMLGSVVPDIIVPVENVSYQIIDWGKEEVDVQIKDYRYLVVNPNVVSVQNEEEISIPFYSSHPVEPKDISMTFQRYNFYANGSGQVVDITVPESKIKESVTDGIKMCTFSVTTDPTTGQRILKINHPLEIWDAVNSSGDIVTFTDKSGEGDESLAAVTSSIDHFIRPENPEIPFSSYTFKITIAHSDNPSFSEEITVNQYPAMYISRDNNDGGSYRTSDPIDAANTVEVKGTQIINTGNVFVNPSTESFNGTSYILNDLSLGGVRGFTTGAETRNTNMYIITISQLDEGSSYSIGDPRTKYTNNNLSGSDDLETPITDGTSAGVWCNLATALYMPEGTTETTRRLMYYYPTLESAETENMIAPKIRIASSYGTCSPMLGSSNGRTLARRRAATYQEQGCPAGRWRLPTLGEFKYIVQLSISGKIPTLFSKKYGYLTAQGIYHIDADTNEILPGCANDPEVWWDWIFVRPVYDEWYWENFPLYEGIPGQYRLGDVPRVLPSN